MSARDWDAEVERAERGLRSAAIRLHEEEAILDGVRKAWLKAAQRLTEARNGKADAILYAERAARAAVAAERAAKLHTTVAEMLASGMTNRDVGKKLGISPITVSGIARRDEIQARNAAIVGMLASGCTLQEAGSVYGISRERVRQ
ncbi:MAG TPA: hypothetical protein VHY82_16065, partial [Acetobacteraceae bacterium]|nr:hypothetical protein [Acetobacteraceae bacterium]